MKGSVSAFILGLIASICGLAWGLTYFLNNSAIMNMLPATIDANSVMILNVLALLCLIGGILGFVGSANSLTKPKLSGIFLVISALLCSIFMIFVFMKTFTFDFVLLVRNAILTIAPIVMYITAFACDFHAKNEQTAMNNAPQQMPEMAMPQQPQMTQPQQMAPQQMQMQSRPQQMAPMQQAPFNQYPQYPQQGYPNMPNPNIRR